MEPNFKNMEGKNVIQKTVGLLAIESILAQFCAPFESLHHEAPAKEDE